MKVAHLLSGGVDSSVALRLLCDAGHDVTAFYLKIWLEDELAHLGECPWEEDLAYAREVCAEAGVPLEVVSLQREYHERVVRWAVEELRAGRTPSPDIWCNERVKFGAFLDLDDRWSAFDKVASGHYARLREDDAGVHLLKGVDPVKDQTYFLCRLDQRQLGRCLFPLGGYLKDDVRRLAREWNLPNRDRPDSQGICFLGTMRYDDFVAGYLGERPGEIREIESDRVLGEHRGAWFHTIGQRRGLGLGGGPWFVVKKDIAANVLWVAHADRLAGHSKDRCRVAEVHWILAPPSSESLGVRIRHSPAVLGCRVELREDGGVNVRLDGEDPGIAPGQWAVFYSGEECLGGGVIENMCGEQVTATLP